MAKANRNQARLRRHQRVRRKIHGTPEIPRLNVFKSLTGMYAQIIDDEAGNTLVSASTIEHDLRTKTTKMTKTEQAKLVGEALAKRAQDKGITQVVFDRGGYRYIGRVKALADAAREAGLKF
jgi:large subunit ribosomal protein L18